MGAIGRYIAPDNCMLRDPVSMVLTYLMSVKIFVIGIKRMDKYLLFLHFFVLINICKQKHMFAGVDIISRENTGLP